MYELTSLDLGKIMTMLNIARKSLGEWDGLNLTEESRILLLAHLEDVDNKLMLHYTEIESDNSSCEELK